MSALALSVVRRHIGGVMQNAKRVSPAVSSAWGLSQDQLRAMLWIAWRPGATRQADGELVAGMADGVALPACLRYPKDGSRIPLRVERSERPRLQSAWIRVENATTPSKIGTLNSILRDAYSGQLYALTCGHVVAAVEEARRQDMVRLYLKNGSRTDVHGRLVDWSPNFFAGQIHSRLDAALISIEAEQMQALEQKGFQHSKGHGVFDLYEELTLKTRDVDRVAIPCGMMSSWFDLDDGGTEEDYFLDGLFSYKADMAPEAGDSGAPLWNSAQQLVAMHIGSGPGNLQGNGLALPLAPILSWSNTTIVTGQFAPPLPAPALFTARSSPAHGPFGYSNPSTFDCGTNISDIRTIDTLARTLWGEARGEQRAGMEAVANVILNRQRRQSYWGKTIEEVCRKPYQFSCWNDSDANRVKLERVDAKNPEFAVALELAQQAVEKGLPDITRGATHYHSAHMRKPPAWASGHQPCAVIGNHLFFTNIE